MDSLVKKHNLKDYSTITDYKKFYDDELPILALEAIEKEKVKFSKIVLDEAQDLMKVNYLQN